MRPALIALLALTVFAALLVSVPAAAQLPAGTAYLVTSSGLANSGTVIGFDTKGTATTLYKLGIVSQPTPDALAMAPTNRSVLVWDTTGVHEVNLTTSVATFTGLATGGGAIHSGCVDEDGGMAWCIGSGLGIGRIYKGFTPMGLNSRLIRSFKNIAFNAIAWIGSTGHYAVAESNAKGGVLAFIGRDGTVVRQVPGIPNMTGLDWSVWENALYVTTEGNTKSQGLHRVDVATGKVTTVGPSTALVADLQGIEVREQPTNLLLLGESGSNPQHLLTYDPAASAVVTLHGSNNLVDFTDVEHIGARALWSTGVWEAGSPVNLSLDFGPAHAGQIYQVALSFGFRPGIKLGPAGTLHLQADSLFFVSQIVGPPLFRHFLGRLDNNGKATPSPSVTVPFTNALQGVRVFGGAIALNSFGVRRISNVWGVTIGGIPE